MKILVIQLKMIGDVLISSIICNNLRKEYPEAQIDYLVYSFAKPAAENNPNITNLVLFPENARDSKLELFKFILAVRSQHYDIVIDAYSKVESSLITMFSGAKRKIGFAGKGLTFSYNEKVDFPEIPNTYKGLAIERREKLIEAVTSKPIDSLPKIYFTESELASARNLLGEFGLDPESDKIVMISILGSEPNKTYPTEYLVKLIDQVANHDVRILFNYIPIQSALAKEIFDKCSEEAQQKIVFDLIGENLRSFMAIMNYCKLIIGNDGGAVNIAKALEKPSFTIFSSWIQKASWSIFEDGIFHKAVHLNDFDPNLIASTNRAEMKKNATFYYSKLKPELFMSDLNQFLNRHLNS